MALTLFLISYSIDPSIHSAEAETSILSCCAHGELLLMHSLRECYAFGYVCVRKYVCHQKHDGLFTLNVNRSIASPTLSIPVKPGLTLYNVQHAKGFVKICSLAICTHKFNNTKEPCSYMTHGEEEAQTKEEKRREPCPPPRHTLGCTFFYFYILGEGGEIEGNNMR